MITSVWNWTKSHRRLMFWVYIAVSMGLGAWLVLEFGPSLGNLDDPVPETIEELKLADAPDAHIRAPMTPTDLGEGMFQVDFDFLPGAELQSIEQMVDDDGVVTGVRLRYSVRD